jgi:hypothetical protein
MAYHIWREHKEVEREVVACFLLSIASLACVLINFEIGLFVTTLFLLLGAIGIIHLTETDFSFFITKSDTTIFRLQGFFLILFIAHFILNRRSILTTGADLFGYRYHDSDSNK